MKILNLYAGIGGNRKLWGDDHDITAIEINPNIARIYQDFFPKDKVIVCDAHQYLLEHFKEFDFIWSSPPCPSHSRFRFMTTKMKDEKHKRPIMYVDMRLYQEIILLQHYFKKRKYVVENVIGYYEPLIKPQEAGRHYFWSNFYINKIKIRPLTIKGIKTKERCERYGLDIIGKDSGFRKDQIMNNCVEPELGLHIFQEAFREQQTLL